MPGAGTSGQQQTQQSTTQPWSPTQPLLQSVIGQLGDMSTAMTPAQTSAYSTLTNATSDLPNFTPGATGVANDAINYSTAPQQGTLTGANSSLASTLSPYLSSSYLNPTTTPGFSGAMSALNNNITNQVNDQFAAAGRDLSPGNTQALATGLSQGEGALIQGQYNQNVGQQQAAANDVFGAANTTASGLTAQQLAQLQAQSGGVGVAGSIPQLATGAGGAQLGVATSQAQQPYTNTSWLTSLLDPIASLGAQSQGTGSSTSTASPLTQFAQLGQGLGGMGTFLFSDERLKENIAEVGELHDGQSVYAYNYKGSDTPHIGLLAQEVEKVRPDAVAEFGPARLKAVDYSKATERSRMIGMLHDLGVAA